jgi:PAS domain S-box-containing protein/diguanylate cyclase (GGDEF)-like protein
MPKNFPIQHQLLAENEDLRERLEKTEGTLREILSGEADALFVQGVDGRQVFTLNGADQSYRTLIESMSEGALKLTPEGVIVYANRRFAEMLRTPLEKVIGSEIHTWFAPESRRVLQTLLRKDAVGNRREELALAAADGTQVPVYLSVNRILLDEMPDAFCMVATDLTERKRNEAMLASEELARAILEQAADTIVICDETGRIIRAGKQAQAFYGKDLLGQLFEHAFPLRQLDGSAFSPLGAIDPNRRQSVEARLEHHGQWFDLLVSVGHLKGARSELLGSVVTLTDITAGKRAAESLRVSEWRFRQMADNIRDVFFLREADSNRMLYVSLAYEEIWGRSCESLYVNPQSWSDAIHPDDRASADEKNQQGMLAAKFGFEYRIVRPDGSIRWIETRGFPVRDAVGKVVRIAGVVADITERKQAEEALQRQQTELRVLFDLVPAMIWFKDTENVFLRVNKRVAEATGMLVEEIEGKSALEIYPKQAAGYYADDLEVIRSGMPKMGIVERLRGPEGQELWVQTDKVPYRDKEGKVIGIVVMARDITEAKRDEEALRESEERFSGAFEFAPIGMALVSLDGRWLKVNRVLCDLVGYSEAELLTRTFQQITHPEDLDADLENVRRLIAGEIHTYQMEKRYVHARGHLVTVLLNVSLVRDGQGQPLHFISQIQDITERKQASVMLVESQHRLALATESAHIGIWDWDVVANKMVWDTQMYELYGIRAQDFSGAYDAWQKGLHPDDRDRAEADIAAALDGVKDFHSEFRVLWPDGGVRAIEAYGSVQRATNGSAMRMIGVNRDITERKRAEIRIKYLNRVYAMLSGINTLIVRVRDRDELFREACRIAVDEGGFRMAMLSLVDRSAMKILPVASAGVDENLLSAIKARLASSHGGTSTMIAQASKEKRAIVSNDSRNDPRVSFGKGYAEAGVRSMAILPLIISNEAMGVLALYAEEAGFFDEEENKLLTDLAGDIAFAIDHIDKQERLDYLAYYDAVTGLANRALFHERMQQSVVSAHEQRRNLALVLLDIERFKTINDTLGRPAGDALLKELAARLAGYAVDVGRLARIDADHFAIMVPDVQSEEDLGRLVEQCVGEVFGPSFRTGDSELRVSAKFGIAMFPDDGADADALFRNAEAALKNAKASGERYLFYTQTMNERVAEKLSLENQLRQALDKEEFVLHYQPKVNLASGKLTSAEALIRWNDPRTGLVPPFQFIPILEETGLIHEVGRWALRKAIEEYLRWRAAGLAAVRIAVNVSPLQLRDRGFVAEIAQVIGIHPLAAAGLELEITESVIMGDVKHSIATLQAIRAMGVTIAIDDFGTGFSSLSYLAKLPVDTLKIDRSFVIGMTVGPEGLALVSTIISLAHALKLKVVAEGVETEEQSSLLRLLDCDEMQGFLFSKPLPVEIFETKFLAPTLL